METSVFDSSTNNSINLVSLDRVNEVKALIESVPKRDTKTRSKLDDNQEKIKNILRNAYTDVRVAQSKIIEKVNQVKYLTERTEILKTELTNSLINEYGNNLKTNTELDTQYAMYHNSLPPKNVDDIMFFDKLLAAQENIDLLLMDSLFESMNTVDVIDSIKNEWDCKSKFIKSLRVKSESLHELESDRGKKWPWDVLTNVKESPSGNFTGLMKKWNKKYGSSNDINQSDEQFYSMNQSFKSSLCFSSSENFRSMTNSVGSHLDKYNPRRNFSRSNSLNCLSRMNYPNPNMKHYESNCSLNVSNKKANKREWVTSDLSLNKNSLTSKCDLSDDEYFSISSFKTNSTAYLKTLQFDSYCSFNSSTNGSSGFHSYSNLKNQDDDGNETFCFVEEPNLMVTSTVKKDCDKDREVCVRTNGFKTKHRINFDESNIDVTRPNTVVNEKSSSEKSREINIFSGFFILFVYFDLRVFLFFIAVFNWFKNLFPRKLKM